MLLVGEPTLARQLRMGVFAALDQRIAAGYAILPVRREVASSANSGSERPTRARRWRR